MQLHMHEWGTEGAAPLVCLHGLTSHGERYAPLAEEHLVPKWFHVLAPDLRGHGRSDWEPPWHLETLVADVPDGLETLNARGMGRTTFMGHSLGGRLVLELAALAPERLGRAVLLDPAIQV